MKCRLSHFNPLMLFLFLITFCSCLDSPDCGRAAGGGGPTSSAVRQPGPPGQAGLQVQAPAPLLTISAPSAVPVSVNKPGFAAALRDLARTVADPAVLSTVSAKHLTSAASFTRVPVVAATSGLTHLGLAAGQPSLAGLQAPVGVPPLLPSYPVHPVTAGILPPSLPTSVPSLINPYG